MRVVYDTVTKIIYERQSLAVEGTLIQNCINYGVDPTNLVEVVVDQAGYEAMRAEDPLYTQRQAKLLAEKNRKEAKLAEIVAAMPQWPDIRDEINTIKDAASAADTMNKLVKAVGDLATHYRKLMRVLYLLARIEAAD